MRIKFSDLPLGAVFNWCGNVYRKKSSRTVEIIDPVEHRGMWFYFPAYAHVKTV